jgi:hypothetical protein
VLWDSARVSYCTPGSVYTVLHTGPGIYRTPTFSRLSNFASVVLPNLSAKNASDSS